MNKKNITFVLVGIMMLIVQFNVTIGTFTFDIFSDIVAFILIAIGGFPLTNRNVTFKKMRLIIVLGLILTTLGLIINICNLGGESSASIVTGLSTIVTIYFTYYFNEGLMLEAKFQEKSAVTRSFTIIWFVFGILIFGNFIAVTSNVSLIIILVQALTLIFAIYYCSTVFTACKQLYMEGLPTKHMKL